MFHRHNLVAGDRPAQVEERLAVHQIEQFHEREVVHFAARQLNEPPGGLDRLALIESETNGGAFGAHENWSAKLSR